MSRPARQGTTTRRAVTRSTPVGALLGALVIASTALAACGSPAATTAELAPVTAPATTTTTTTTQTSVPTTVATTTAPTTAATTTTVGPRQQTLPIAPPQDVRGPEDNPPIGRITIAEIGLDAVLHEGIRLTTLDRGPGHWPGSAMPGELGNVVVGGHRTSRGAEFRHLDQLLPGDEMVLTSDTGSHTYVVTGTEIVGPEALWITDPTDSATATLFACHPLGSTAERIVVFLALAT